MDDDDYELAELRAERKLAKQNNRYWAQNDPEAPDDPDYDGDDNE
jgi:hypothetical protein